ncbi:energy transducer TonB [Pelagibaculum spongiae]|uniref:Protein TonB n=1 Tax=Pelagibaculum spongiae TaxID=2080658 RepID=A0A2V1H567_9GAMM|nr:energy transducer TonB [Pelagibaculum spongiae]PVZ72388.1 hypothetical protein DC094_05120 [Pelagibaculum spongiae]
MNHLALPSSHLAKTLLLVISAFLCASLIAIGLFISMNKLVHPKNTLAQPADNFRLIDFIQTDKSETIQQKKRLRPEPPKPVNNQPQPQTKISQSKPSKPQLANTPLTMPELDLRLDLSIDSSFVQPQSFNNNVPISNVEVTVIEAGNNSEAIPLSTFPPVFPSKALRRKIEGFVTLSFTVTKSGRISNIKIIESDPKRIFDREAIKAIRKWKFQPKKLAGQAVESQFTQKLEFKLGN